MIYAHNQLKFIRVNYIFVKRIYNINIDEYRCAGRRLKKERPNIWFIHSACNSRKSKLHWRALEIEPFLREFNWKHV